MNLQVVIWTSTNSTTTGSTTTSLDFDSNDWQVPGGEFSSTEVVANFDKILIEAAQIQEHGFIVLEHDLWPQTVDLAVGYLLPSVLAKGFTIVSITDCLGIGFGDVYLETNNNVTHPLPNAGAHTLTIPSSMLIQSLTDLFFLFLFLHDITQIAPIKNSETPARRTHHHRHQLNGTRTTRVYQVGPWSLPPLPSRPSLRRPRRRRA